MFAQLGRPLTSHPIVKSLICKSQLFPQTGLRAFKTCQKSLNYARVEFNRSFTLLPRVSRFSTKLSIAQMRSIVSKAESAPPIPMRTYVLFSLSLAGVIGAYMAVSWLLTSTNAYSDAYELLRVCPKVYEYTGFPFHRQGRVKGKSRNGEILIQMKLQGDKGMVKAIVYGKEIDKNKYELVDITIEPISGSKYIEEKAKEQEIKDKQSLVVSNTAINNNDKVETTQKDINSNKVSSNNIKNNKLNKKEKNDIDLSFTVMHDKVVYEPLFENLPNVTYSPAIQEHMKTCPPPSLSTYKKQKEEEEKKKKQKEEEEKNSTTAVSTGNSVSGNGETVEHEVKTSSNPLINFWMNRPWYYKIGFAIGLGLLGGLILGFGLTSMKVKPTHNSAFQAAFKLLKEDSKAQELLGKKMKAVGTIKGKAEENWANFSIKIKGNKNEAFANVQGVCENNNWKFSVISLDTKEGKVYIKK
ncbi:hypothetical protein WA158_007848 [Blastocystis sp. Blastoise]